MGIQSWLRYGLLGSIHKKIYVHIQSFNTLFPCSVCIRVLYFACFALYLALAALLLEL